MPIAATIVQGPRHARSLTERALDQILALAIAKERSVLGLYLYAADVAGADTPLHAMFMRLVDEATDREESLMEAYGNFRAEIATAR